MENTDQAMWTAPRPEPGTATMGRGGAPGIMKHCTCVCACIIVRACHDAVPPTSAVMFTQNSSLVVTTLSDEIIGHKIKVKVTLEQATKAQRGRRGIAILFL